MRNLTALSNSDGQSKQIENYQNHKNSTQSPKDKIKRESSMASLWTWIFGEKQIPNEPPEAATKPDIIDAPSAKAAKKVRLSEELQIEVLSQFRNGANPDTTPPEAWNTFWQQKLGIPFQRAAVALYDAGLLHEANLVAKLAASKTLVQLKAIAKREGLKVSGRKSELVARLVEHSSPEIISEFAKARIWVCSEAAQKIVQEHRENKKIELKQARVESLDLLRHRRLKQACDIACEYEQAQFYPRGIGVNWYDASGSMHQELKLLYAAKPKFHARRFGPLSSELRERAAMSILWGTEAFGDIFPKPALPDQATQISLFSRMLVFHGNHLRNLKQCQKLEASGLEIKCEILVCEDENTYCAACLGDSGRVYRLEDVPELPHEYCECALGCRCTAIASINMD